MGYIKRKMTKNKLVKLLPTERKKYKRGTSLRKLKNDRNLGNIQLNDYNYFEDKSKYV